MRPRPICALRLRLQLQRRAGRKDFSVVHGDERIEPLGLLHVGGRDDHAHPRRGAGEYDRSSSQNWRRDSGSTPVVGSSRIRRSGSWMSEQHRPSFCRMPPDKFLGWTIGERRQPGAAQKIGNAPFPFGARLPEQAGEEFDVLADAEVGIKILSQSLRHVGDARAHGGSMSERPPCLRQAPKRGRIAPAARRQSC